MIIWCLSKIGFCDVKKDGHTTFDDGLFRFDDHICVLRVGDLIKLILYEANDFIWSITPRTIKI